MVHLEDPSYADPNNSLEEDVHYAGASCTPVKLIVTTNETKKILSYIGYGVNFPVDSVNRYVVQFSTMGFVPASLS